MSCVLHCGARLCYSGVVLGPHKAMPCLCQGMFSRFIDECWYAEAPAGRHITSSDWAFSSPTPNLPALMRGISDACSEIGSSSGAGDASDVERVAALTDVACAAFRGARSARQAAESQFGAAYEPKLQGGAAGWLGSVEVRNVCMHLMQRCLTACGTPSAPWLDRILQLAGHLVARCGP